MRPEHEHRVRRGRTGRWLGLLRMVAVGVPGIALALLASACSAAPASETERAIEFPDPVEASDPTTTTTALPITHGALRGSIVGRGEPDDADEGVGEDVGSGPEESPETTGLRNDPPDHVIAVGDSVLVLVADDLASRLPSTLHVDAADCRRIDMDVTGPCGGVPAGTVVDDGLTAIRDTMAEAAGRGITPEAAVIVLANNSSLDAALLDEAMDALDGVPRVWWVTTRIDGFGRQDPNNALLADLAERDPRARVIDWFEHSRGRDWLGDHVHPNPIGERALSALIARHLRCDCVP